MRFPTFPTLDAVQDAVLRELLKSGASASPRGIGTIETIASGFTLENPRARVVANRARRWSKALAVGEFAWHASASDDVEALAYYAPVWRRFSEDGAQIRGSCYGKRIFERDENGSSQWDEVVRVLRSDPASRRAVLSVQQGQDRAYNAGSVDVPCVCTCQYLLRDGRLDAIVHMRSNDVIWGVPYDVFLFTMMQEMLAIELGVGLGRYHHFAGSLHLYDRHVELARRILASIPEGSHEMPPMTDVAQLPTFIAAERALRERGEHGEDLAPYWRGLLEPVAALATKRTT